MFELIAALTTSSSYHDYAEAAGAQFISASRLTDPITHVEIDFVAAWQRDFRLPIMPTVHLATSGNVQHVHEVVKTGYVLDFKTERWGIDPIHVISLRMPPERYRATYHARARVVRVHDEEIVWQAWCRYGEDATLTPQLTSSEITGDDRTSAVKKAFQTLGQACADHLWKQFVDGHVRSMPSSPQ